MTWLINNKEIYKGTMSGLGQEGYVLNMKWSLWNRDLDNGDDLQRKYISKEN